MESPFVYTISLGLLFISALPEVDANAKWQSLPVSETQTAKLKGSHPIY